MRTVDANLLCDGKLSDSVAHYISSHHISQDVSVDTSGLHLGTNDDGHRIVTVMHQNNFSNQTLCRQISVAAEGHLSSDSVGGWGEDLLAGGMGAISGLSGELTEEDRRLATALMAVQFVQQGRQHLLHDINNISKVVSDRHDVETNTNLIDGPLRLYHHSATNEPSHHMRSTEDLSDVDVRSLTSLPPMPPLKRIEDNMWFHSKADGYKQAYKEAEDILNAVNGTEDVINLAESSPIQNNQHSKKSLPHKKRISRKLKNNVPNGSHISDSREDLELGHQSEEALPDNDISENGDHPHNSIRPVFICQICGDFYGEDQLKFYNHLKHHYEPHNGSMTIENSLDSLQHDSEHSIELGKIGTTIERGACEVVDNAGPLPEALVELSLSSSVQSKLSHYHQQNQLSMYTDSNHKSIYNIPSDKNLQTSETMQNKSTMYQSSIEQNNGALYDPVESLPMHNCPHCGKLFKRIKAYENHIKIHTNEELNEFSEPEDLMEGIRVVVDAENDEYIHEEINNHDSDNVSIHQIISEEEHILPHLTIENGHVHQEHLNLKQWYVKNLEVVSALSENEQADSVTVETVDCELDIDESEFACPLCGEILTGRITYSQHAELCHIHLKEDVLQRMMDVEVEVSSAGTTADEIISNGNENSNQAVPETNPCKELEVETLKEKQSKELAMDHVSHDIIESIRKKIQRNVKSCEECGREFTHRNSLIYHILSHSDTRPYQCKVCSKGFLSKSALKVHSTLHSGLKNYKCKDCGRKFRQWGDLRYHVTSLHSVQKMHKCEYCNKEFARKYSLSLHRRIHTGEKNFMCEFCNKTFRASSYLQNHRRIHTGEKPYACGDCGKTFRVRGDMRRHQVTHTKFDSHETDKNKAIKLTSPMAKLRTRIKREIITSAVRSGDHESSSIPSSGEDFLEITKHDLDQDNPEVQSKLANTNLTLKTHIDTTDHVSHHLNGSDPLDPLYVWPIFMS